jgi:Cell division protein CrgA
MPESRKRKKKEDRLTQVEVAPLDETVESPKWLVPVMVASFIIGLIWIVIFYMTETLYPIPDIGAWNMMVGFGFIGVGFTLATRWR